MASGRRRTRVAFALGVAFVLAGVVVWLGRGADDPEQGVRPISGRLLYPGQALRVLWRTKVRGEPGIEPELGDFTRYRPIGYSAHVPHVPLPQHPFMARGGNNMHNDAYISDAYEAPGPRGLNPRVRSRTQGFGGYGTLAFDRFGRIVAVYSNGRGFQLELMDADTLEERASFDLPSRPWYFPLQGLMPWEYIGAGMYFYLDERDRAFVPTTENVIEVIQTPRPGTDDGFQRVRRYDLSGHVVPLSWPQLDSVAWVLPDWQGGTLWYATTAGLVGTIDEASGAVRTRRLEDEIIENSFAVGEEGVFIVSDRALYRFVRDAAGEIAVGWRSEYDRGPGRKPGHITRGSGTSVTLMGGRDGLVAITDNAEPQVHVQLYRRSDGERVCSVPVFTAGRSGTDISVAAFEHADEVGIGRGEYSVVAENNWGHHSFPLSRPEPGLIRVDARRRADGSYDCGVVWSSNEKSIGVFKFSLGSGLIYMYGHDDSPLATGWYFTAVDFRTGETVYRKNTGFGHGYNNWAGVLFLHPGGGVAYTTTIFGLVEMRDAATATEAPRAPVTSSRGR